MTMKAYLDLLVSVDRSKGACKGIYVLWMHMCSIATRLFYVMSS